MRCICYTRYKGWDEERTSTRGKETDLEKEAESKSPEPGVPTMVLQFGGFSLLEMAALGGAGRMLQYRHPEGGFLQQWAVGSTEGFQQETDLIRMVLSIFKKLLAPLINYLIIFWAVLGLRFYARASSSCGKQGPLFIAVRGPLTIAASLVAEHRLQTRRLSNCGSRA